MDTRSCWIVSDGTIGMESQSLGLAEAIGLPTTVKRASLARPWYWLPANWVPGATRRCTADSDRFEPPWPDLLIACGRRNAALSLAVRRAARGRTFTVHIQNPLVDPAHFDLVVPPEHDRMTGANVVASRGSLTRITGDRLAAAAAEFAPLLADLPRPLVAVLIGGRSRAYQMSDATTRTLIDGLARLCQSAGAGLAVTASRRTGPGNAALIRDGLKDLPYYFWDGEGANPYFGFLALADAFVVTADSVNMVSEALSTGKPVHVAAMDGGSDKFRRFHSDLERDGYTRPFQGRLENWTYQPLDETSRIAAEVKRRLGW